MTIQKNELRLDNTYSIGDYRIFIAAFALLFLLNIIIYSNSFNGQWQFDDFDNIIFNDNVHLTNLSAEDVKKSFFGLSKSHWSRPLSYFSFALNYYFGGSDIFGYHIVNFAIHYLTAVFLFLFIFNSLKLPVLRDKYGPSAYSIALLSTVLWSINPLQQTAVTYVVQRMASMAGMFFIAAMYFYLKGRTANTRCKGIAFFTLCFVSALAAFATKENTVMLPIVLFIFDLLLIKGLPIKNIKPIIFTAAVVLLIPFMVALFYFDVSTLIGDYKNLRPFSMWERLATQPRIFFYYISLLLYPISSRLVFLHDVDFSKSLIQPWTTLFSALALVIIFILAVKNARKRPLLSFCVLFFFLNHLIEGSIFSLEMIYEHRNYIPSMLLFVPVVILIINALDFFKHRKSLQYMIIFLITLIIAAESHTTYLRNDLFLSPVSLWRDCTEKSPNLSAAHNNLGKAYWDAGYYEAAFKEYNEAIKLQKDQNLYSFAVYQTNIALYHSEITKKYALALQHLKKSHAINPQLPTTYTVLAKTYLMMGRLPDAKRSIERALRLSTQNAEKNHFFLSFILLREGNHSACRKEAYETLRLTPDYIEAFAILGQSYKETGHYERAIYYWQKYLTKEPAKVRGHLAIIELFSITGRKKELRAAVDRVIGMKNGDDLAVFINKAFDEPENKIYSGDRNKLLAIIRNELAMQALASFRRS